MLEFANPAIRGGYSRDRPASRGSDEGINSRV